MDKIKQYSKITKWIQRVIDSCQTWEQTKSAFTLVSNFEKTLMKDEDYSTFKWFTTEPLIQRIYDKRNNLMK